MYICISAQKIVATLLSLVYVPCDSGTSNFSYLEWQQNSPALVVGVDFPLYLKENYIVTYCQVNSERVK